MIFIQNSSIQVATILHLKKNRHQQNISIGLYDIWLTVSEIQLSKSMSFKIKCVISMGGLHESQLWRSIPSYIIIVWFIYCAGDTTLVYDSPRLWTAHINVPCVQLIRTRWCAFRMSIILRVLRATRENPIDIFVTTSTWKA